MLQEIFDNGQLNVEISNVVASKEEIEKLKACITQGIGNTNAAPLVRLNGMDQKSIRYTVKFAVRGPAHFNLSSVQDWLYSVGLVGWNIESQAGPKE